MTPKSQDRFEETFEEFWREGAAYGVEHEMVCKDRSVIEVSIDGKISGGENGDSKQTHCVFQDITQRKRTEEALKASEQRYRATFDNAAVGIDMVDSQGRFLEVNETLAKFLGYTQDELRDLTIWDVTHPKDLVKSREMLEAFVEGRNEVIDLRSDM